jgi:hypothetical protein
MHYTTVSVGLVEGHEAEGIDNAIGQGLEALSKEIGGPVELVSVVPVPASDKLCMVIMAKPYEPPIRFAGVHSVNDVFTQLKERR